VLSAGALVLKFLKNLDRPELLLYEYYKKEGNKKENYKEENDGQTESKKDLKRSIFLKRTENLKKRSLKKRKLQNYLKE